MQGKRTAQLPFHQEPTRLGNQFLFGRRIGYNGGLLSVLHGLVTKIQTHLPNSGELGLDHICPYIYVGDIDTWCGDRTRWLCRQIYMRGYPGPPGVSGARSKVC
eukprot:sb/3478088/